MPGLNRPRGLGRPSAARAITGLLVLLLLLVAGFASGLQAAPDEEKIIEGKRIDPDAPTLSVLMEWTSVKIAEGYVLQIADEQGRMLLDLKDLDDPSVTIKLRPGRYQRRIGIVNKFGKLSFWSPWENFRLVQTKEPRIENLTLGDHTPGQSTRIIVSGENLDEFTEFEASAGKKKVKIWRKQVMSDGKIALDVDTTTLGDEAKVDIEAANPGKDPDKVESALVIDGREASVNQPSALRNWSMGDYTWLIPGYDQFERGDSMKGYLISGGILFFSAASVYYAQQANALVTSTTGDPLQQLFGNVALYNAVIPGLPTATANALRVQQYNSYNSSVNEYNAAKNNSYTAAGLALLIYGYHLWDVYENASPDGIAIFAQPRSLKLESSLDPNFLAARPAPYSPEQRRLTETYMGAGYRIHF